NGVRWSIREFALGSAGVGVPLLLIGTIAGLMRIRDTGRSAIAGVLLCAAGLVTFAVAYPERWNVVVGVDYSGIGVMLYGVGLALLVFRSGGVVTCRISE
ncbi:MAG: hypothetical protein ABEH58_05145, partial [Haloplanus sp.]